MKCSWRLTGILGLALAHCAVADDNPLAAILSPDAEIDRRAAIEALPDAALRGRLLKLLPEIEKTAAQRRRTVKLQAEVESAGGKIEFEPGGPDWLRKAAGDAAMELFSAPVSVDLYNGNNPLKGKGGRNEAVTDAWLAKLTGFSTLESLTLTNCAIEGEGLRHISGLTGLTALNLTLTPVTDPFLEHLSGLTQLRSLGLASAQCSGAGFAHLKALTHLDNVNFHFTPLDDEGLKAVCEVGVSGRLWFAHTHFTDAGAVHLAKLTNLKNCGIGSKSPESSGAAVAFLAELPLEELALLDRQASAAGVANAARIKTLKRLDVLHAPDVGDEALRALAAMPVLEELKLTNSKEITDAGVAALAQSGSLKKVTLQRCKNVTEGGLAKLRERNIEVQTN